MRGLCIVTGLYSSFCGCAVDLVLGGFDHLEDDDQDRGDEETREGVEALEREEDETRDETLTLDVRDVVTTNHCKTQPPYTVKASVFL